MKRNFDWSIAGLVAIILVAVSLLGIAGYGVAVSVNKEREFAEKNEYVIVTDKYTKLVYHKVGYANTFLRKRTLCVSSLDGSETNKINVSRDIYDAYNITDTVKFENLR